MECSSVDELNEKGIRKFIDLDKWGGEQFCFKDYSGCYYVYRPFCNTVFR